MSNLYYFPTVKKKDLLNIPDIKCPEDAIYEWIEWQTLLATDSLVDHLIDSTEMLRRIHTINDIARNWLIKKGLWNNGQTSPAES